jgi:hypothetical protein
MARKTTNTSKVKSRRAAPVKKALPLKTKASVVEFAPEPRVRKNRTLFRAGTLIAVLLLLAMIELTVYLKQQKEKTGTGTVTAVSKTEPVFTESGNILSIEIKPSKADEQVVKVVRNEKNVWAVELPNKAEADQGAVEAAATQISALRVITPIDAGPEIFGLKDPAYVITIEFQGGKQHTLEVGSATPTNSGYYVRVDKNKMMITDLDGIQSLLQLVTSPPYLSTATPPPLSPTLTPVPATEVPQTPTPTP